MFYSGWLSKKAMSEAVAVMTKEWYNYYPLNGSISNDDPSSVYIVFNVPDREHIDGYILQEIEQLLQDKYKK